MNSSLQFKLEEYIPTNIEYTYMIYYFLQKQDCDPVKNYTSD